MWDFQTVRFKYLPFYLLYFKLTQITEYVLHYILRHHFYSKMKSADIVVAIFKLISQILFFFNKNLYALDHIIHEKSLPNL